MEMNFLLLMLNPSQIASPPIQTRISEPQIERRDVFTNLITQFLAIGPRPGTADPPPKKHYPGRGHGDPAPRSTSSSSSDPWSSYSSSSASASSASRAILDALNKNKPPI